MNPSVLIVIASDPRTSPRAAEAVRIAAGISVWGRLDVQVCLQGAAVQMLGEFPDDLMDGDQVTQCLPMLARHNCSLYVGRDAVPTLPTARAEIPFQEIDASQLGALAAQCRCLLRF